MKLPLQQTLVDTGRCYSLKQFCLLYWGKATVVQYDAIQLWNINPKLLGNRTIAPLLYGSSWCWFNVKCVMFEGHVPKDMENSVCVSLFLTTCSYIWSNVVNNHLVYLIYYMETLRCHFLSLKHQKKPTTGTSSFKRDSQQLGVAVFYSHSSVIYLCCELVCLCDCVHIPIQ